MSHKHDVCDSGALWYETTDEHLQVHAGLKQTKQDPALYTLNKNEKRKGMLPSHVDDLLCAGKVKKRNVSKNDRTFRIEQRNINSN